MSARIITGRAAMILKFSLAGMLLFFAALAVYIVTFDINHYREQLQSQASTALGRDIKLQGDLSMGYSLLPTIVAEKILISNPEWASRPHFASIDTIRFQLELFPLLFKEIKIASIEVDKADVLLEINNDGENNWQFLEGRTNQESAYNIHLEYLGINDSIINLRDSGKITERITVSEAKIEASFLNTLSAEIRASHNGVPVLLEIDAGDIGLLFKSTDKSPLDLHVVAGENSFDLDGTVTSSDKGNELTGDIRVRGKKISELFPEFDNLMLDSVQYDLTANMTAKLSGLELAGLKGEIITPITDHDIRINQGEFAVGTQIALSSHFSLEYADMPIEVSLSSATLDEINTGDFPAQGLIQAGNSSIKINGAIREFFTSPQAEYDISLQGDDFVALQTLLTEKIPELGTYKVDLRLTSGQKKLKANITSASLSGLAVKGALSIDRSSSPVVVSAELSTKSINLEPYRKIFTADKPKQKQPPSILDKPFELDLPQNAEINLRVRAGKVTGLDTPLNDVDITLHSSGKQLVASPLKFRMPGMTLNGKVSVRPTAKLYAINADIAGSKLNLEKFASNFGAKQKIKGKANKASLKLDGKGKNLRDLLTNGNLQLSLIGAQFDYATGSEKHQTLAMDSILAKSLSGEPIAITYAGKIKELPLTGKITIDRLIDRMQQTSVMPIRLESKLADARLSVTGKMGKVYPFHDMDLMLDLSGKKLKSLEPVLGLNLSTSGPYSLAGKLTKHKDAYVLSGLKGKINQSDFAGKASIRYANKRPQLVASLQANKFLYYDIFIKKEPVEKEDAEAASDKLIISDLKIPVSALKSWDAELDIKAKQFNVGDVEYDDLAVHADLRDGNLVLEPFKVSLSGGQLNGHFKLIVGDSTPAINIKADGTDVDYGELLETFGLTDKVNGKAKVKISVTGAGVSTRELLAKSNGYIEIISGKGSINTSKLDLWAADLVTVALTSAWEPEQSSEVNCTVAKIDLHDGVATSDVLMLDTTRITVAGSGTLDLSTEELKLLLIPKPKTPRFVSLANPAQITGFLSDPQVALAPGSNVKLLGGLLVGLASPATLLLTYGKSVNPDTNPCLEAVKHREADKAKAASKVQNEPERISE